MKLERILVPIDFSERSAAALAAADELALLASAREVTLLHVHAIAQVAFLDFTYVEPPERVAGVVLAAENRLKELAKGMRLPEAQRKLVVETGQPLEVILGYSANHDVIVMPTHGRTGASHFFLGSVAERVVQAAKCSVLVVK
ncbi:universal stress protein [Myxococcota bacterium]|nr:universal stress protein [Myxococcota bacterium]